MDDEIALVPTSMEGRVVINVSDVESYGLERPLIGDSTVEDSDDDDKGSHTGLKCLLPRSVVLWRWMLPLLL